MAYQVSVNPEKSGIKTSEFWRGVILKGIAVFTLFTHKQYHGAEQYVPLAAVVIAGIETCVYTIQRNGLKKSVIQGLNWLAVESVKSETPVAGEATGVPTEADKSGGL